MLDRMISGDMSPEEASAWAHPWVTERDGPIEVSDAAAWDAICAIGGADLPSSDRNHLYGVDDFREWRSELDAAP